MTRYVAIDATQLITTETATVRQRMNTSIAEHANDIFLRYLGTFITHTLVRCKLVLLNIVLKMFLVGGP
jgi:hypothetical protein